MIEYGGLFIVINKQHNKTYLCGLGADALNILTDLAPAFNVGGLVAVPVADVVCATNFFLDYFYVRIRKWFSEFHCQK